MIKTINLNKEGNEDIFEIIKENGEIVQIVDKISIVIESITIKRLIFIKNKILIKNISVDIHSLQTKFNNWKDVATNFCLNPHYAIDSTSDLHFSALHYTINLLDMVNSLELNVKKIVDNYNLTIERVEAKINFRIAIFSFLLTFVGLIVSLVGLFISLNTK
jgi:hypothetical protein